MANNNVIKREDFDPTNSEHRKALFTFISESRWIKHFNLHKPYLEIPHQCMIETLQYYADQEA